MDGFFMTLEELPLAAFPGITFSGWLEVDHDRDDGWYVARVWLDNANTWTACPHEVEDAIKKQIYEDDDMMQRLRDEARYHNEV